MLFLYNCHAIHEDLASLPSTTKLKLLRESLFRKDKQPVEDLKTRKSQNRDMNAGGKV